MSISFHRLPLVILLALIPTHWNTPVSAKIATIIIMPSKSPIVLKSMTLIMKSKLSSASSDPKTRAAVSIDTAPIRATEVRCKNSNERTTKTETRINAEKRIIGLISWPIAGGTPKISVAKATISARPMATFLRPAFGCVETSKTYLVDNY